MPPTPAAGILVTGAEATELRPATASRSQLRRVLCQLHGADAAPAKFWASVQTSQKTRLLIHRSWAGGRAIRQARPMRSSSQNLCALLWVAQFLNPQINESCCGTWELERRVPSELEIDAAVTTWKCTALKFFLQSSPPPPPGLIWCGVD